MGDADGGARRGMVVSLPVRGRGAAMELDR